MYSVPTTAPRYPYAAGVIVAVVLTYDPAPGMLDACVDALVTDGGVDRIVVVDNGTDAADHLRAAVTANRCEIVRTRRNRGYAGGMNAGITRALELGAEAIALLNDDVVVEAGWIAPLADELASDPRLGAVQPKLLFAGTDPPIVNSVGVQLDREGSGTDVGYGRPDGPEFEQPSDVLACTGGAVVLRREFVDDVGLFDERYFLYYEDVDLALRGTERGWRQRCVPASRVWHRGGATVAGAGTLGARLRERNRLWVLARHRSAADVRRGIWLAVRRVRHRPRGAHLRGLVAGLAGVPVRRWERRRADSQHPPRSLSSRSRPTADGA
jgi:N-acetylglucosaminyl-diphospho-decaprenol L-rhamnosyltransferase